VNWVFVPLLIGFLISIGLFFVILAKQDQRLRRLQRERPLPEADPLARLREQLDRLTQANNRRFAFQLHPQDAQAMAQDMTRVSADFNQVFQNIVRVGTRIGYASVTDPEEIAIAEQNLRAAGIEVETLRDHAGTVTRFTKSSPAAPEVQIKKVKSIPPSWHRRLMDDDE
jgi:hypothetical protein